MADAKNPWFSRLECGDGVAWPGVRGEAVRLTQLLDIRREQKPR